MLQQWLDDRCGVYDTVCYRAPWRTNVGCRYPHAALGSEHRHAQQRPEWRTTTWPQILRLTHERKALRRLGEAAACPPWGPLPYTWARRGPPPTGKTAGTRQGDKVCGLLADCTGRRVSHGQAGRLNSAPSMACLTRGLAYTPPPLRLRQDGARDQTSAATSAFVAQQAARLQVCQWPTSAPDDHPLEPL